MVACEGNVNLHTSVGGNIFKDLKPRELIIICKCGHEYKTYLEQLYQNIIEPLMHLIGILVCFLRNLFDIIQPGLCDLSRFFLEKPLKKSYGILGKGMSCLRGLGTVVSRPVIARAMLYNLVHHGFDVRMVKAIAVVRRILGHGRSKKPTD